MSMMIQHKNTGTIYRQDIPFQWVTHDWNNDGDIYQMYVSYFDACRCYQLNHNTAFTKESDLFVEEQPSLSDMLPI